MSSGRLQVAPEATYDATDAVVGLARTLRAAGVPASPERVHATVDALRLLDPRRRDDVYWAGRLTLCASEDDIARYDRVFAAYFGDRPAALVRRPTVPAAHLRLVSASADDAPPAEDSDDEATPASAAASATEILRHRDIAGLSSADRAVLARLLAAFALPGERRRTRRRGPAPSGSIDRRRTLQRLMHAGGEPAELARQPRPRRPRPGGLLVDINRPVTAHPPAPL